MYFANKVFGSEVVEPEGKEMDVETTNTNQQLRDESGPVSMKKNLTVKEQLEEMCKDTKCRQETQQ